MLMIHKGTVNLNTIKTANREKILRLLMARRELTKQEISKKTGISIPTVTNNLNQLVDEGIAEDAGVSVSTGGRRPAVLRFLPDSKFSFGIDLAPKKVRIVLVNLDAKIRFDTTFDNKPFKRMDEIIDYIRRQIDEILIQENISKDKVLGAGISLYGTVNEDKMILETAPNFSFEVKNINFNKYQKIFDFPIFIENDANVSALAELSVINKKQLQDIVFVSIETGIGCGIIIKGQLFKGDNKRAGEFGHMTVASNGLQCTCGGKDCWELYASERALLKAYNKKSGRKLSDIEKFFSYIDQKDNDALNIWNTYLDYLAIGIRNIVLIHDPRCIIIGGKVSRYENVLIEPLKDRVFSGTSFFSRDDVVIRTSTLKENSSVIGASLLALQEKFFLKENVI